MPGRSAEIRQRAGDFRAAVKAALITGGPGSFAQIFERPQLAQLPDLKRENASKHLLWMAKKGMIRRDKKGIYSLPPEKEEKPEKAPGKRGGAVENMRQRGARLTEILKEVLKERPMRAGEIYSNPSVQGATNNQASLYQFLISLRKKGILTHANGQYQLPNGQAHEDQPEVEGGIRVEKFRTVWFQGKKLTVSETERRALRKALED